MSGGDGVHLGRKERQGKRWPAGAALSAVKVSAGGYSKRSLYLRQRLSCATQAPWGLVWAGGYTLQGAQAEVGMCWLSLPTPHSILSPKHDAPPSPGG